MSQEVLISIIDDDDSVRLAVAGLIRSHGYRTAAYESAEAFLACDGPEQSACVITDIQMPGMSGFDLKDSLDARGAAAPVIMITARADDAFETRAKASGAHCFLRKPFDADRLMACVEGALS